MVESVAKDGPADAAGIQTGDVLVSIDGEPLKTAEDLVADLRERQPGDVVRIRLLRGDEQQDVDVTLSERDEPDPAATG